MPTSPCSAGIAIYRPQPTPVVRYSGATPTECPGSGCWTFQAIETAIFVALASAPLVFSVWFVRCRLA